MKYHAIVRGGGAGSAGDGRSPRGGAVEDRVLEVTKAGDGYKVVIDGRELDVDAVHLKGGSLSVLAGTRSARCDIQPGKDGKVSVLLGDTVHELELLDERRMRMRGTAGKFSAEGPQRIDSPMPGKVVRVLCKVGDEVTEGQGLIVVEAMKMEHTLTAPYDGVVSRIVFGLKDRVQAGAVLVELAPSEEKN